MDFGIGGLYYIEEGRGRRRGRGRNSSYISDPIRSDLVPYYPIPVHPNLHPFPFLSSPPVTPWDALRIQLNPPPPLPFLSLLLSFLSFHSPPRSKERLNHPSPSPSPNSEETRAQQPNRKTPTPRSSNTQPKPHDEKNAIRNRMEQTSIPRPEQIEHLLHAGQLIGGESAVARKMARKRDVSQVAGCCLFLLSRSFE